MDKLLTTIVLTVLALAVAAPAIAGGGDHGGGGCRGFSDGDELLLQDSCIDGTGHVVEADTTLTVRNEGQLPHTLTAVDGSFDTGILEAGESTELELTVSGAVPVHCTLHASTDGQGMAGLLVVSESGDVTDTAAAPSEPANEEAEAAATASEAEREDPEAAVASTERTRDGSVTPWGAWLPVLVLAAGAVMVIARRATTRGSTASGPDTADVPTRP